MAGTVISTTVASSPWLRSKLHNPHLHDRRRRYNQHVVTAVAHLNSNGSRRIISHSCSFVKDYYFLSSRRILGKGTAHSLRCKSSKNTDGGAISATASAGPPSNSWRNWILGAFLSIILPFWKHKWAPLLMLKKEVDNVVETFDTVIEIVEKVAEGVEKVADEVAEQLPEGGKLQQAVCMVEQVAKKVHEDAHATDEFIHKVEDMGKEIEKGVDSVIEAMGDDQQENVEKQQSEGEEKEEEEEEKDEISQAAEKKKVGGDEKMTVAEENVTGKEGGKEGGNINTKK